MTERRYTPRQRQKRPRSPWVTLVIPFVAIVITGIAFYFFASMLGGGAAPTPTPDLSTPTPTLEPATATPEPVTPTPEATPTLEAPTATPPPAASDILSVGGEATVKADTGLRVRSGPGTSFEQVTTLDAGVIVAIIGGPERSDTYTWWQIRFPTPEGGTGEGWAAGDFLDPALAKP